MNTSTKIFPLLSILLITIFASCSKRDNQEQISIVGEWTTSERRITSGDDFLDQSINNLFILDSKDYIVTRTFTQTEYNTGSLEAIATYKIINDSLHIDDKKFEQTTSSFTLSDRIMTTYTKVGKKELDHIIEEIGGDPNLIPNNIEAVLKMKEIR